VANKKFADYVLFGQGDVFSPDGKRLVSGGKVWNAESGQEIFFPEGMAWPLARTAAVFRKLFLDMTLLTAR
jgi:hypothetical protein